MTDLNKAISRRTRASVPHGVKPEIIVTLYPGGTIGLRENGRRKHTEVFCDVGRLYQKAVENKIVVARLNKALAKSKASKLRRLLK